MVRPEGCNHTRHDEVVFVSVGVLAELVRQWQYVQCVQDYVRNLAE